MEFDFNEFKKTDPDLVAARKKELKNEEGAESRSPEEIMLDKKMKKVEEITGMSSGDFFHYLKKKRSAEARKEEPETADMT